MGDIARLRPVAAADGSSTETIAERFERQAAATPDAPAVLLPERIVTYRALNAMAETVACKIETLAPSNEAPIALAIEDAVLGLAAMLGAAKTGYVFIPLDL